MVALAGAKPYRQRRLANAGWIRILPNPLRLEEQFVVILPGDLVNDSRLPGILVRSFLGRLVGIAKFQFVRRRDARDEQCGHQEDHRQLLHAFILR